MKKLFFFTIILLLISNNSFSQFAIGASVIRNFQSKGTGFGARLHIPLGYRWAFTPQAALYPDFNKVNEYYAGANLQFSIIRRGALNFYLIGGGGYNGWINHEEFNNSLSQYNNWDVEAGGGFLLNKWCIRPFAEYRYNFKWKETNGRIGLLFLFGNCKGSSGNGRGGSGGRKKRKSKGGCWSYY